MHIFRRLSSWLSGIRNNSDGSWYLRMSWRICRIRRNILGCSLRIKILVALAAALLLVTGFYTYLLLRVHDRWNADRTQATHALLALSVQEQFSRNLLSPSGIANHPPKQLKTQNQWLPVWVIDQEEKIIASNSPQEVGKRWDPTATSYPTTVSHLPNQLECQSCHSSEQNHLAKIVVASGGIQLSKAQTIQERWIVVYGLSMSFLIIVGVSLCLLKFVKDPLARLVQLMRRVQSGELNVRFHSRGKDEVSQLGHGFNRMIRSLAKAQRSLQIAHGQQMQQAEKLASVGELASGLAHEIRNPLAGIKTAVQVLTEKIDAQNEKSDPSLKEVATEVSAQVERVHRLVGDLLQYVRPKPPKTMQCDVRLLIEKCMCLIRPQAEKQSIFVRWDCLASECEICADPEQIQQAFLNILINALQAMPQGGTLTMRLTHKTTSGMLMLSIHDTGAGMSEDTQKRLFSPFFTTKPKGTGLGLSITRGIIQNHGGDLSFESKTNHGTTFTLTLPLIKVHGCSQHATDESGKYSVHNCECEFNKIKRNNSKHESVLCQKSA
jgi:two-component system, NtrC family, sensor kinase